MSIMTKYDAGECTQVLNWQQWNIVIASIFSFVFSPVFTLSWFYRANAFAIIFFRVPWATACTMYRHVCFFFFSLSGCLKVFNKWCVRLMDPKSVRQPNDFERSKERTKYIFLLNFNRFFFFFSCPFHFRQ